MSQAPINLAILFADVSGSTRLYETLGDAQARTIVERCLDVVAGACKEQGGQIIKTIGDEMMTTYPHGGQRRARRPRHPAADRRDARPIPAPRCRCTSASISDR